MFSAFLADSTATLSQCGAADLACTLSRTDQGASAVCGAEVVTFTPTDDGVTLCLTRGRSETYVLTEDRWQPAAVHPGHDGGELSWVRELSAGTPWVRASP